MRQRRPRRWRRQLSRGSGYDSVSTTRDISWQKGPARTSPSKERRSATIGLAMSVQSINAETRELLGQLRNLLLEQHKLLLDRERAAYEKTHGAIGGPGAFLTLVIDDPHF